MDATPTHRERSFLIVISLAVILGFYIIYRDNFQFAFLPNFGSAQYSSGINYQVSTISTSPSPAYDLRPPITVTATIKKFGSQENNLNRGTWVRFYVKGMPIGTEVDTGDMAPNSQKIISFSYIPSVPGDYSFKACADSRSQVLETSERDNCHNMSITVLNRNPIYSIEDINWTPQNPKGSDPITFTAVVKRVGGITQTGPTVNLTLGTYKTSKQAPMITTIASGNTGEAIVAFAPISYADTGGQEVKICVVNLTGQACRTEVINIDRSSGDVIKPRNF